MKVQINLIANVDDEAKFLPSDGKWEEDFVDYLKDLFYGIPDMEIKTIKVREVE